jgi:hypothetical protein
LNGSTKVRFTRHALEKFGILKRYGFEVKRSVVADAVSKPDKLECKGDQFFATKPLDAKHAVHVVYEKRKVILLSLHSIR